MTEFIPLPDDVIQLIDYGFSHKNKEKGLEVGDGYFLSDDFVENLISVLGEYEIKSDYQGELPSECRDQIWRTILNNIDGCVLSTDEELVK